MEKFILMLLLLIKLSIRKRYFKCPSNFQIFPIQKTPLETKSQSKHLITTMENIIKPTSITLTHLLKEHNGKIDH